MMRTFAKAVAYVLLGAATICVFAAAGAAFAWFWFTSARFLGAWVFFAPLALLVAWAVGDAMAVKIKGWLN